MTTSARPRSCGCRSVTRWTSGRKRRTATSMASRRTSAPGTCSWRCPRTRTRPSTRRGSRTRPRCLLSAMPQAASSGSPRWTRARTAQLAYANLYLANGAVIVPACRRRTDEPVLGRSRRRLPRPGGRGRPRTRRSTSAAAGRTASRSRFRPAPEGRASGRLSPVRRGPVPLRRSEPPPPVERRPDRVVQRGPLERAEGRLEGGPVADARLLPLVEHHRDLAQRRHEQAGDAQRQWPGNSESSPGSAAAHRRGRGTRAP